MLCIFLHINMRNPCFLFPGTHFLARYSTHGIFVMTMVYKNGYNFGCVQDRKTIFVSSFSLLNFLFIDTKYYRIAKKLQPVDDFAHFLGPGDICSTSNNAMTFGKLRGFCEYFFWNSYCVRLQCTKIGCVCVSCSGVHNS